MCRTTTTHLKEVSGREYGHILQQMMQSDVERQLRRRNRSLIKHHPIQGDASASFSKCDHILDMDDREDTYMDERVHRQKIRLDFSSDNPLRWGVPFDYARQVYLRLMQSPNRHICAEMQYVQYHFFYLFKSPNGYTFGVSDPDFEPRIQQITSPSVLGVLSLASIPGGFAHDFCPLDAWKDAPFPTFNVNDQGHTRMPIKVDGRTLEDALSFLRDEATPQDLREIFEELQSSVGVRKARVGENKGRETIHRRFWAWSEGTPRINIETYLTQHPRWQSQ